MKQNYLCTNIKRMQSNNKNEVNEPSNAILRDFDDYLMDDAGHVATNNDENVVYNEQLYCCSNLLQQNFCCNKL